MPENNAYLSQSPTNISQSSTRCYRVTRSKSSILQKSAANYYDEAQFSQRSVNSVGRTCVSNSNGTASRGVLSNSKTSDENGNIVEEEKQCPFLKFLNLQSAEDPHLLLSSVFQLDELTGRSDDLGPEDDISQEAVLFATEQQQNLNGMSLEITDSAEYAKTQSLRYLTNVQTVDVYCNFEEASGLHAVRLLVNSIYNFYSRSSSVKEALDDCESQAVKFFQTLNEKDPKEIGMPFSRDSALLLNLIETRHGVMPNELPVSFEFDFENRKWQSFLNMKETTFISKICTSKTQSINDVLLKYFTNT